MARRNFRSAISFVLKVVFITYLIFAIRYFYSASSNTGHADSADSTNKPQTKAVQDSTTTTKAPVRLTTRAEEPKQDKLSLTSWINDELDEAFLSVFFLAVPHTAHSEVQRILLRKAMYQNVTVAVPEEDQTSLCYPMVFKRSCPGNRKEAPFNMIVHKLRYDDQELNKSMVYPHRRIMLLQNPIKLIQAAFYENKWSLQFNMADFETFVMVHYSAVSKKFDYQVDEPYRNIQLFSLNVDPTNSGFRNTVSGVVSATNNQFDLVMIQERFLESLVLLKHLMNWEWKDMALFTLNQPMHNYPEKELTAAVNSTIHLYNAGDVMFYKAMVKKLDELITMFGPERMKSETMKLLETIEELKAECLKSGTDDELSDDGEANIFCHYLIASSQDLTNLLLIKHR